LTALAKCLPPPPFPTPFLFGSYQLVSDDDEVVSLRERMRKRKRKRKREVEGEKVRESEKE